MLQKETGVPCLIKNNKLQLFSDRANGTCRDTRKTSIKRMVALIEFAS